MERSSENEEWLKARLAMSVSGLGKVLEDSEELDVDEAVLEEVEEARESARAALRRLEDV